jgi:hypothetical protein
MVPPGINNGVPIDGPTALLAAEAVWCVETDGTSVLKTVTTLLNALPSADPLVANAIYWNAGVLTQSLGVSMYSPAMDFSDSRNSMYLF